MNLLFISTSSKIFHDKNGNLYLNPHITNEGFRQYKKFTEHLTLLLRDGGLIGNESSSYEQFDTSVGELIVYPNIFNIKSFFNIKKQLLLNSIIKNAVKKADKVICGTQSTSVISRAVHFCKKYNKPYMIFNLGMVFEGQWYHSWKGKLVAFPREWTCIRLMRNAPYAIYVTQEASQKRYPCKGKSIGCSDVELDTIKPEILHRRLKKIADLKNKIIIGTAAYLDVKWKGHHLMLKALTKLKKEGYNIEYQMIGLGSGERIKNIAHKLNITENIKLLPARPHNQMYEWYDNIDIYVQPSYQEGLCRSIVEAMSRACPIVCSNAGGNYELIENKYIFNVGDYTDLTKRLKLLISSDNLNKAAKRNFEKAKEYDKKILNKRRWDFIQEFIND